VGQVWDKHNLSHWDKHSLSQSACPTGTGCACPSGFSQWDSFSTATTHSLSKTKGVLIKFRKFLIKNRSQIGQKSKLKNRFFSTKLKQNVIPEGRRDQANKDRREKVSPCESPESFSLVAVATSITGITTPTPTRGASR